VNAYFDASGLVKLLATEPGSDLAMAVWDSADIAVTSRITYVEARAALAAAQRQGRLSADNAAEAGRGLESRFRVMQVVEVTEEVAQSAGDLAGALALRGYDAVHLASSLTLADDTVMVTWDRDLAWAAYRSGLDLAGISLE
jgi:predicted nucleic acid-binding protein